MLTLVQLAEVHEHLGKIPALFDAFEGRKPGFRTDASKWIHDLEDLLKSYNLPEAYEISLIRADIALGSRRVRMNSNNNNSRSGSRRAQRLTLTADGLKRAGEVVVKSMRITSDLIAEGERIARQLAAIGKAKGVRVSHPDNWPEAADSWKKVLSDNDLISAATHLTGLVGRNNAIILFARAQSEV